MRIIIALSCSFAFGAAYDFLEFMTNISSLLESPDRADALQDTITDTHTHTFLRFVSADSRIICILTSLYVIGQWILWKP